MGGQGSDLEFAAVGQQSRDMQRDAPFRLGACAMFVTLILGTVLWVVAEYPFSGWWLFPMALGVGLVTRRFASLRLTVMDTRRNAVEQADRKKRKDAELAAFLKEKNADA